MYWKTSSDTNDDNQIPTRDKYNSTLIQFNVDFDYTERIYNINYYTILDIMAILGGLKASIMPIFAYLAPLLALHFLMQLARIIDEKMHENQHIELL